MELFARHDKIDNAAATAPLRDDQRKIRCLMK